MPLTALLLFFPAATCGTALYAAGYEAAGWRKKKAFLSKLGRQYLNLALALGLFSLLAPAITVSVWIGLNPESLTTTALWPLPAYYGGPLLVYSIGLLILVLASLTWKGSKNYRILRVLWSLLGAVFLAGGLYTALNSLFFALAEVPPVAASPWLDPFIPHFPRLTSATGVLTAAVGLGAPATLGLAYLLWRRNTDDFGRDYYRYAAPRCVPGSLFLLGQAVALSLGFWALDQSAVPTLQDTVFLSSCLAAIVSLLLAIGLPWRLRRSQTPMRHKITMVVAPLFTWLSLVAALSAGLVLWPALEKLLHI